MTDPVYKNVKDNGPSDLNVILWLLFICPVGIFKMWKYKKFQRKARWAITGVFVLAIFQFSQTGNRSAQVKPRAQATIASELERTRRNFQINKLGQEIQAKIQAGKNPLDYAVTVSHIEFNGHDLISCNVNNGKANCGLYEVIEKDGAFSVFWVNGRAKEKLGSVMKRTPSSINASDAYKAATK